MIATAIKKALKAAVGSLVLAGVTKAARAFLRRRHEQESEPSL